MKKNIIIITIFVLTISIAYASYWVKDPNSCPTTHADYPGFSCAPNDICGDPDCYDTSTLTAPGSTDTSNTDRDSGTCQDGTCNGGYVLDCFTDDGVGALCDGGGDYWCDRNSTCYTTQGRDTICTANLFGRSTCGDCRSDYLNCDTDNIDCEEDPGSSCDDNAELNATCRVSGSGGYAWCICDTNDYDCDNSDGDGLNITGNHTGAGNGCEITLDSTQNQSNQVWRSCTFANCSTNYYDCNGSGTGSDADGCEVQNNTACSVGILEGTYNQCTCNIDDQDIATTGTEVLWSGANPMLWMTLFSNSVGINITFNSTQKSFIVNTTGVYWDNIDLTTGSGGHEHDQDLNTTDDVKFQNVNVTDRIYLRHGAYFTQDEGGAVGLHLG